MASSTASPLEIQSALRHSFRLPTTGLRSSPVSDNSHGGRSPRVIRFGDEVDDSDLEMTDSDCDNDKKEQAWVREMLQELSRLGWQPTPDGSRPAKRSPNHCPAASPRPSILATSPYHGFCPPDLSSSASSSRTSSFSSVMTSSSGSQSSSPPGETISQSLASLSSTPTSSPQRKHHRSNSVSLPHSHRLTGGSIINTSPLVAIASPAPGTAAADLARHYTVNAGTSGARSSHARRMSAGGRLEVVREERED